MSGVIRRIPSILRSRTATSFCSLHKQHLKLKTSISFNNHYKEALRTVVYMQSQVGICSPALTSLLRSTGVECLVEEEDDDGRPQLKEAVMNNSAEVDIFKHRFRFKDVTKTFI